MAIVMRYKKEKYSRRNVCIDFPPFLFQNIANISLFRLSCHILKKVNVWLPFMTSQVLYSIMSQLLCAVVFEDVTLTVYYAVRGFSCRVTQTHFQQECLNYPLMFEDSLMKRWNFG